MQVHAFLLLLPLVSLEPAQSPSDQDESRTLHGPKPAYLSSVPCPSEAYFRHPRDCRKFYRCVDVFGSGKQISVYEGTCDHGLVFDEKISSCNWPALAEPCSSEETQRETYKPKDYPKKSTTKPPFAQEEDNEIWQELAEVENPKWTEVPETSQPFQQEITLPDDSSRLPLEEIFQDTVQQTSITPQSETVMETTKKSCVQEQVLSTESTTFSDDQISQQTVKPFEKQETISSDWWIPDEQDSLFVSPERIKQQEVNNDPVFCKEEGFFRHPGNCSRFYRCVFNEGGLDIYTFDCPHLLVFNETISSCQRPLDTECASHESAYRRLRVKRSPTKDTTSSLPCFKEGFFRHPNNCQAFYRCVSPKLSARLYSSHVFTCPDNLVFDEEKATCNWPQKSAPCGISRTSVPQSDKLSTKFPVTRQTSKSKATRPTRASQNQKLTPSGQVADNPKKLKQVAPRPFANNSSRSPSTRPKCKSPGFFTNRTDCNKYYKCVDDGRAKRSFIRYDFECPHNLAFDEKTITCKSPYLVSYCKESKSAFLVRQNDDSDQQIFTSSPPSTERSIESSEVTSESADAQDDNISCENEGYFRHPSDCNKFYRCVDFKGDGVQFVRYDFSCHEGLVFDELNSVCNWPSLSPPCDGREDSSSSKRSNNSTEPSTSKEYESTTSSVIEINTTTDNTGKDLETTFEPMEKESSTDQGGSETPTRESEERTTSESEIFSTSKTNNIQCTKEGFFRNPEDCNKFYRCVDFRGDGQEYVRYDFACPEDLVFDELNSVCNWPTLSPPCDDISSGRENSTSRLTSSTENTPTEIQTSSKEPSSGFESTSQSSFESSTGSSEVTKTTKKTTITEIPSEMTEIAKEIDGTNTTPEIEEITENTNVISKSTNPEGEETTSGSTSSSQEKIEEILCTEEGFFRNPNDCNQFYRCVDFSGDGQQYVRYDFSCPEGLVFDETNSVCNWPSESSECDGSGSRKATETSPPSSTATDNIPNEIKTTSEPDETTRSTTEGITSDPEETDSSERTSETNEIAISTSDSFERTRSTTETDETSGVTDVSTIPSEATDIIATGEETDTSTSPYETTKGDTRTSETATHIQCIQEGFFRNPNDCNKFYRCVDFKGDGQQFVRYDFECPEGLVFDEVNSVCNWPTSSPPCESGTSKPKTTEAITPVGSTDPPTPTSSDGRDIATDASSVTSQSTTSGELTSQTSFEASSTETDETETATDQVASEKTSQSTVTDSVTNLETTSAETVESLTTDEITTSDTVDLTSTTEGSSTEETGTECTEEGFFGYPDDCNKFYRCVDFRGDGKQYVRYDFVCPEGLVFDEVNSVCNWPASVPSCKEEVGTTTSSNATESEELTSTSSSSTSEESVTSMTDVEKTTSDTATYTTDQDGTSFTTTSSSRECIQEGFSRDPNDCRRYYRCVQSDGGTFVKQEYSCKEDEVFDEDMLYCNKKELSPPCTDESGNVTESEMSTESITDHTKVQTTTTEGLVSTESPDKATSESTGRDSSTTAASKTTPDSPQDIECTEEGFFRFPGDCNKFYRCVDFRGDRKSFVRYDFVCPEGLVFDEINSVCNWPTSTSSCNSSSGNSTSKQELTTPTSGGETETSSLSTQGMITESTTSSDGQVETTSSSTTSSEITSTGATEDPIETTSSSSQGETTSSGDAVSQTETSPFAPETSSQTPKGENANVECKEAGFFRHPEDCSKFYRCVDFTGTGKQFVRYDFECPEGLVFDERVSVCNWPDASPSCETNSESENSTVTTQDSRTETMGSTTERQESIQSSTVEGSSEQTATSTEFTTVNTESTQQPTESQSKSSDCIEEGFFRDLEDCSKYYQCSRNPDTGSLNKKEFHCPDGHIFDEVGRYCNSVELTEPCDNSTAYECTEEGFFRDPDDCSAYIQCVSNNQSGRYEQRHFKCPEGHVFDEEGRYCNAKELSVPCDEKESTTSNSVSATDKRTTNDLFSGSTTQSDEFECEEEGFFRDPKDCRGYYQCIENNDTSNGFEKRRFDCPENHVFDEEGRYCNSIELSPPCDTSETSQTAVDGSGTSENSQTTTSGSTISEVTTTTMTVGETEDNASTADTDESLSTTSESRTTSDPRTSGSTLSSSTQSPNQRTAECNEAGFFRNPNDCGKFYRCVDFSGTGESFVRYDFDCPNGLVFDEVNSVCTWPTLSPACKAEGTQDDVLGLPGKVE